MKTTPMKAFLRPQVADYVRRQASKRQLSVSATIDALLYEAMQGPTPARQATDKPQAADDAELMAILDRMRDK